MSKKNFRLSEIISLIGGGTPKRSMKEYWNGDIPWLVVSDFNNDSRYVEKSSEKITQLGLDNSSTKLLKPGMLIISARGTVGKLAQLNSEMAFSQSCYGIDAKTEFTNNDYLYYLLKVKIKELQSLAHGSIFDTIIRSTFDNIFVDIPSHKEQEQVVSILSNLDKKIKNNEEQNKTLEQIAKTLFKSWFIDFDPVRAKVEGRPTGLSKEISDLFPDSFQDSELGEIPKGWRITTLNDITSKFTTGLNPRKNFVLGSGDNFYVTIKNLGDFEVVLDDKCDKVDDDAIKKINSRSDLKENDILFSGIGTIGKVVYVFDKVKNWNISESVFSLRANSEVTFPSFLYQLLKSYPLQGYVQALAGGSVQRGIRMGSLKEYQFTLSNFEVQQLFHETISPMIEKISLNLNETKNLINIRDTLLPNLFSGELKIPDAENLIEEAGV